MLHTTICEICRVTVATWNQIDCHRHSADVCLFAWDSYSRRWVRSFSHLLAGEAGRASWKRSGSYCPHVHLTQWKTFQTTTTAPTARFGLVCWWLSGCGYTSQNVGFALRIGALRQPQLRGMWAVLTVYAHVHTLKLMCRRWISYSESYHPPLLNLCISPPGRRL